MKKRQCIFLSAIVLILAAGCQKEHRASAAASAPQAATAVAKDALTGRWAINSFTSSTRSGAGAPARDMSYKGQKGDYYQFDANGALSISQAGKVYKCGYEWTGNQLTLLLNGSKLSMQVLTLNATTLELVRSHSSEAQQLTESRSFTRQ